MTGGGGHPDAGLTASFNGGRLGTTDVLMDGISINIQDGLGGVLDNRYTPTIDLIQEMKVQTNTFSAEYGLSGNAIVTMVSRSGTNAFHGDVYEYNYTQHFEANNWFTNHGGYGSTQKPVMRHNEFGIVAGGPVVLPHLYNGQNKTFFFYHYEKIAQGTALKTDVDTVPTAAEKQGDFTAVESAAGVPVQIFDPTTYNANACGTFNFGNGPQQVCGLRSSYSTPNVIPQSKWDSVGAHALPFYPNPTGAGSSAAHIGNYYWAGTMGSPWDQEDLKFDENISSNQRFSFRYSRTPASSLPSADPWGAGNYMAAYTAGYSESITRPSQGMLNYTYVISPTTILNIQGGTTYWYTTGGLIGEPSNWDATKWGYANNLGLTRPPVYWMDESYSTLGPDVWAGNAGTTNYAETQDQIAGTLTKVKGKHTFKFGLEERFMFNNESSPGLNTAGFDSDQKGTAMLPTGLPPQGQFQGDAIATMLAGWGGDEMMGEFNCFGSTSGGCMGTSVGVDTGGRQSAVFAADDFRVNSKLTLSLGLRYELNWPFSERWNRMAYVDPYMASPLNTYLQAQGSTTLLQGGYVYTTPYQRHVYDEDLHDFAPRFGFAWQFKPQWVARGGYGLFYGPSDNQVTNFVASGYTSATNYLWSLDNGAHLASPFDNPFPNGIVPVTGNALGAAENLGQALSGPYPGINSHRGSNNGASRLSTN